MELRVLGIDPGFATCGVCVVRLRSRTETVEAIGVITTVKSLKKTNTMATEDNVRRGRELASKLTTIVEQFKPTAIAAESMSFPRNASSSAKIAMCWGVLCGLSYRYSLPIIQASPQQIKIALCHVKTASKVEVQEALIKRYSGAFQRFTSEYPSGQHEHGFDAVGAVVACLDSEVIRMARGMTI